MQTDTAQLADRHVQFWEKSNEQGPLTANIPHPDWRPKPYPLRNGISLSEPKEIQPENVDIEKLLGIDVGKPELAAGDMIHGRRTVYPVAWMEAVLGCPIYASAFSCTSKPAATAERIEFSIQESLDSPWLGVMDSALHTAVRAADGSLPVVQLHLRGVSDMLAAYLGEERLCTGLYYEPDSIERLADTFAGLYISVAERGLAIRPPWRGGYVSSWGIYAPGPLLDYQLDASSIISPELYRRHLLAYDAKIIDRFPYSVVHLHACGLHMVDVVAGIDARMTVEITLERKTGVWKKDSIVDACRRIQRCGKSVLVNGELNENEFEDVRSRLDPRGSAIFYWHPK